MNTQRPIPLRPDASLLQAAERRSFVRACAAIALGVRTSGRRKAVAAKLRSGALLRGQACPRSLAGHGPQGAQPP